MKWGKFDGNKSGFILIYAASCRFSCPADDCNCKTWARGKASSFPPGQDSTVAGITFDRNTFFCTLHWIVFPPSATLQFPHCIRSVLLLILKKEQHLGPEQWEQPAFSWSSHRFASSGNIRNLNSVLCSREINFSATSVSSSLTAFWYSIDHLYLQWPHGSHGVIRLG